MRAAVLVAPGRIEIHEKPDPVPGPLEVVVRVDAAGVCGTDLALFAGDFAVPLPLVPGHELAGTVVDAGVGVPERWAGARVTTEISLTCLTRKDADPCVACRRQLSEHCRRRKVIGLRDADGVFAERILLPVGGLYDLPEKLPPTTAVLVEPLAAAIRTFKLTPVGPGSTVVVLGAGRLGLLACRVARSHGARVWAASRSPEKRERAERFGAEEAFDAADPGLREAILERTEGLGADVVVEATGAPEGFSSAIGLVRPRGTIALKTTCGAPVPDFPATELVVREITVQGSRCGPFPEAIERLAAGQVPVDALGIETFPLDRVADAFAAARSGAKAILLPNG